MPQATERAQNARDQQIAANGLSTPQDAIAMLLHRLVRPASTSAVYEASLSHSTTVPYASSSISSSLSGSAFATEV